jgi:hypothetical protein
MTLGTLIVFALLVIGLFLVIKYLIPERARPTCYLALGLIAGLILLQALLALAGLAVPQWLILFALVVIGLALVIRYLIPAKYRQPCYAALGIIAGLILLWALLGLAGVVPPLNKPLV